MNAIKNIGVNLLENKAKMEVEIGWGAGVRRVSSSSGNAYRLSEDVFSFIEWNELPVDGRTFDGHYEIHVNYKTFEYRINQHAYYGSLTYTTPARESGWKNLNEKDKAYIEARIAAKLLGMYFYDYMAVNGYGKSLFSDGTIEPAGCGYNEGIVRWRDGCKISLICEKESWWSLNPYQELAVKELQN